MAARNRKRARDRRARPEDGHARSSANGAPQSDLNGAPEGDAEPEAPEATQPPPGAEDVLDDLPGSLEHAAPDVEIADAQVALGAAGLLGSAGFEQPRDEGDERYDRIYEDEIPVGAAEPTAAGETVPATVPAGLPTGEEEHKPGMFRRLATFLRGSWRELHRVQWPDRRQVMQATGVVLGFVIVAGIYLGVADYLAQKVVNLILK